MEEAVFCEEIDFGVRRRMEMRNKNSNHIRKISPEASIFLARNFESTDLRVEWPSV